MRVGILSMQRVINFGSFLQAYGLKQLLEDFDVEASFVDIRPGEYLDASHVDSDSFLRRLRTRMSRHPIQQARYNRYVAQRKSQFEDKWFPLIGIDCPANEEDCDAVVIGSDEVFNVSLGARWGVSYQLFGDVDCAVAFSYAGSFANTTYENLCALHIEERVAYAMSKLRSISVRDSASAELAEKLTGREALVHLDPVLVADFSQVVPSSVPYDNYILVYSYDNRFANTAEIEAIREFARSHNKELISFGFYQNWCDRNILVDPFTLLSCFDHADYVVTDTFHGSVLSIKRNRPFATFVRDSNSNKVNDLMKRLDLNNRLVCSTDELSAILEQETDYSAINTVLASEATRSKLYLRANLA